MLGQPACPRNEAPAELPITSPAAIAGHSASHWALHTSAAHSHASPVSRVNRAPSHSSSQSRPHDLAAQQALCDHSTKYSKLAASTWLNGRKALAALQDRVAEIGRNYGLERGLRGSPAKHESVRRWYGALNVTQNDRRLQPVKLLEVPRAPHFVDKLAGRASEMQRVREQAEAHNRAARAHNRERMRLLAQMAGQGFGRRQSQKERARLEQEAKLEKEKAQQAAYQAEQAVLSKRTLALRAQQNDKVVQMLKTELAAQK